MPIELTQAKNGKVLEVKVSGKLRDEDYQQFDLEFERLAKQHDKIRVLFAMSQFHGWDAHAAWDDLKFDLKHYRDIERVAAVGEKQWQRWATAFYKPFTGAVTRYFDQAEAQKARLWLEENLDKSPGSAEQANKSETK